MKLTTPRATLIGLLAIATAILLRVDDQVTVISEARADVAGMDYRELSRDRDFKKAVWRVVSGNCYVDAEYIYC